ncbi:mCG6384 [Mus musculus]|nr:mCG6384 [Mus musculus]
MKENRERRKDAGLPSESNEGRRRWTWRMWKAGRQTSSPATVLSKRQAKNEEERLTTELQLITQKRNEPRDRLLYVTDRSMNKRPYHRANPLYEKLKVKEMEVMLFLHKLEMENIEALKNNQELKKEINFYCSLHSQLLMEKKLMKKKLFLMKQESKEVQGDWTLIQQCLLDLNLNGKDEHEKTSNLQDQQHQVSETTRELGLATAQEESILKNESPPQEPPAELHLPLPHSPRLPWMNLLPHSSFPMCE